MNRPGGGLGRGLGALIPSAPPTPRLDAAVAPAAVNGGREASAEAPGVSYTELPLGSVRPNPRQPRTVFDEEAMGELVASISEVGLLQPVVVRAVADGQFELVMGERRWRASKLAGLTRIPAIIRATTDDVLLRDALLENVHRADLNPLEEAAAYEQLLSDFGCTHDELAQRVGRSRPQISNTIRLLNLSAPVQRRVAAGVLSAGHARALLAIADTATQDALAARVVAEGISVRGLEELISLPESPRRSRHKSDSSDNPDLTEIARGLEERFETRCRVELGKTKGRLTVEFATIDDLHRILALMEPPSRSTPPPDE